jgi:hypothetical protein
MSARTGPVSGTIAAFMRDINLSYRGNGRIPRDGGIAAGAAPAMDKIAVTDHYFAASRNSRENNNDGFKTTRFPQSIRGHCRCFGGRRIRLR